MQPRLCSTKVPNLNNLFVNQRASTYDTVFRSSASTTITTNACAESPEPKSNGLPRGLALSVRRLAATLTRCRVRMLA